MTEIIERKMMLPLHGRHITVGVRVLEPETCQLTILYFHRFGGSGLEFMRPARELVAAGCRVVCMEMLGHDGSEWLNPGEYAVEHDIAFARGLIDSYADEPFMIIGNGWGNHLALRALATGGPRPLVFLMFDYVNAFTYNTDIIMPFEYDAAGIITETPEDYAEKVTALGRPMGEAGAYLSAIAASRVRKYGDHVALPVHQAAFEPFRANPDAEVSSGFLLASLQCKTFIVNGQLAAFKNLLRPPPNPEYAPKSLATIKTDYFGYLDWEKKSAAPAIIEHLRRFGALPQRPA